MPVHSKTMQNQMLTNSYWSLKNHQIKCDVLFLPLLNPPPPSAETAKLF